MMLYTLVIWTVVGFAGKQYSTFEKLDWRPLTTHSTLESCEEAARKLGYASSKYRCIKN